MSKEDDSSEHLSGWYPVYVVPRHHHSHRRPYYRPSRYYSGEEDEYPIEFNPHRTYPDPYAHAKHVCTLFLNCMSVLVG